MFGCALSRRSTFLAVKKTSILFTAKNVELLGLYPILNLWPSGQVGMKALKSPPCP